MSTIASRKDFHVILLLYLVQKILFQIQLSYKSLNNNKNKKVFAMLLYFRHFATIRTKKSKILRTYIVFLELFYAHEAIKRHSGKNQVVLNLRVSEIRDLGLSFCEERSYIDFSISGGNSSIMCLSVAKGK